MAIHTPKELREELSNNGSVNVAMLKQMMSVMLTIIDHQAEQIKKLQFDLVFVEEKTKDL